MQVLASQLLFLANRNAGQAIPPLCWPVNWIKIGGHVALLSLRLIAYTACTAGPRILSGCEHANFVLNLNDIFDGLNDMNDM